MVSIWNFLKSFFELPRSPKGHKYKYDPPLPLVGSMYNFTLQEHIWRLDV